jgi:hypothetical protein
MAQRIKTISVVEEAGAGPVYKRPEITCDVKLVFWVVWTGGCMAGWLLDQPFFSVLRQWTKVDCYSGPK